MSFLMKFTKLMKSAPKKKKPRKYRSAWTIDESKCLSIDEVKKLRAFCNALRESGLQEGKFAPVRNWFMIELGLETGLRVAEMASLNHANLLIEAGKSSITVIGKGSKKRAIWINSDFKQKCQTYINFKKRFGYEVHNQASLLNNLKGSKITTRF